MAFSRFAAVTLLCVVMSGAAGAAKEERFVVYTPTNAVVSSLGAREARRILKEAAERAWFETADNFGWTSGAAVDTGTLTLFTSDARLTFPLHDINPRLVKFAVSRGLDFVGFETTANARVISWRAPKTVDLNLKVTEEHGWRSGPALSSDSRFPGPTLREVSDALFVLQSRARLLRGPDYARRFDEAVVRYRGAAVKPELPEEVRRYLVQAGALVRANDPDRASCLYVLGLELAPWWAEGHYDLAIYSAALDEFDDAIIEMKRYLALAPDAPDARAAQEQVYEWEVKVR